MGIKLVFFVSIINSLFSYNLYEAAPINDTTLIVNFIANDFNACANKSVIYQSKYLQQACNVSFPDVSSEIKNNTNINQYLCAALYDRSVKVCHLKTIEKHDLFTNQTAFDEDVNKIVNDNQLFPVCGNWQNNLTAEYNATKPYIIKFNDYLRDLKNCALKCSDETNGKKVNPLCAMIYYIDEKIRMNQSHLKEKANNNGPVVKSEETGTTNVVTPKETIPAKNEQSLENTKTSQDKPVEEKAADSGPSTLKNDKTKPNLEIPGDKTTPKINEQTNKAVVAPPLDQPEQSSNSGVEKPDTIVQTINDEESNIPHPEADIPPEEENDQMQFDDADKMIDQDPIGKPDDKPDNLPIHNNIEKDDDAHFFGYFTILGLLGIGSCLAYHHKQKIFAILLEGRRSRGGRGRRRPSTASYRKLDCTLEEAVTSQCNTNVTHVIY